MQRTGGSPFLGLLAARPIIAQSVAPQKSTSPPAHSVASLLAAAILMMED